MISANEARFRSANGAEIKKIKEKIETAINETVDKGMYSCNVYIPVDTKDEVRNRIKEDIEKLGYRVKISDSRHISDPYAGYSGDTITIMWGEENDI